MGAVRGASLHLPTSRFHREDVTHRATPTPCPTEVGPAMLVTGRWPDPGVLPGSRGLGQPQAVCAWAFLPKKSPRVLVLVCVFPLGQFH